VGLLLGADLLQVAVRCTQETTGSSEEATSMHGVNHTQLISVPAPHGTSPKSHCDAKKYVHAYVHCAKQCPHRSPAGSSESARASASSGPSDRPGLSAGASNMIAPFLARSTT